MGRGLFDAIFIINGAGYSISLEEAKNLTQAQLVALTDYAIYYQKLKNRMPDAKEPTLTGFWQQKRQPNAKASKKLKDFIEQTLSGGGSKQDG